MTDREDAIIKALRSSDYNRFADHVQEQFDKGMSYNEVWADLREILDTFHHVAWLDSQKNSI
ncbi:hypothetical protein PHIN3_26 [Sinorhizobium phage phiN3]|uniref:Uncharacterized protein n=1 Tax=Sinorhizobium phage phiN3 TaxID=1647405 RepID=A0A0F6YP31_9CAUD|nr:hypothetical protein AVT40_gp026 [Sinorhizobium phage phiN3]AKF13291.1 hypothetical protein PHIN3_26 [Sinorhizobium phage phiN3]